MYHGTLYTGLKGITTHQLEALRAEYWIENEQCRKTVTPIYSVFWDVKSVRGCGMPLRFVPAISADKLVASGMHRESHPAGGAQLRAPLPSLVYPYPIPCNTTNEVGLASIGNVTRFIDPQGPFVGLTISLVGRRGRQIIERGCTAWRAKFNVRVRLCKSSHVNSVQTRGHE